jgi:hypothetical protein
MRRIGGILRLMRRAVTWTLLIVHIAMLAALVWLWKCSYQRSELFDLISISWDGSTFVEGGGSVSTANGKLLLIFDRIVYTGPYAKRRLDDSLRSYPLGLSFQRIPQDPRFVEGYNRPSSALARATGVSLWFSRSEDYFNATGNRTSAATAVNRYHYYRRRILVHCHALLVVLLVFPVGWSVVRLGCWYRARRRDRLGLCPRCGYDLRATPERCPECGLEAVS